MNITEMGLRPTYFGENARIFKKLEPNVQFKYLFHIQKNLFESEDSRSVVLADDKAGHIY